MKSNKKKSARPKGPKYNPSRKPQDMTLEEWQKALRRQAAVKEALSVRPVDRGSEGYFQVVNPTSTRTYSVVFRGKNSSWNYCSCPDFRTNQLGTCKHIEAVASCDDGKYNARYYNIPSRTSVYLDYRGPRRVRIRIGGQHSDQMQWLASKYFDSDRCLLDSKVDSFSDFLTEAIKIDSSFKCFDDALDFIISRREHKIRASIADSNPDLTDNLLKVPLYPYQKQGAEFAFRQGRVVIADEMGLGKTIQAIAAAMLFKKHGLAQSVWIICPTSLKYQWKKEIEKFTDETVLVVEGDVTKRVAALSADKSFFKIISYHSMVNTVKHGIPVKPDLVVYDEVQRLKNWDTKMSKEMRRLKSDYVVALSGTPLENKLVELYSVMQLVDQFVLGPYWKFVAETTDTDDTGRVIGYRNLNKVGDILKSTLIRRLKKDVRLQMPSRTDKTLFVPVTKEQMAIHDDCKWNITILLSRWRNMGFLPEKDRRRMLMLLSMMRMAADSTYILDQKSRHDTKIDEAVSIVEDIIESGDEKIVIFSQWERMQRLMVAELEAREIGFRFLHGGVPSVKRGTLIEDFMSDPECRVFLSTDAGSTGLNLQAASIVINLDLPWNPAVLEQRIARVFRLGQQRQVQVINMVSVGTIEQQMLDTLAFKTGLFEGVLDGGEDSIVLSNKKFDKIAELVETTVGTEDESHAEHDSAETDESHTDIEEKETDAIELTYEESADEDDFIQDDIDLNDTDLFLDVYNLDSETDDSETDDSETDDSETDDSETDDSETDDSETDDSETDDSETDDSETGDSTTYVSDTDNSESNDSEVRNTADVSSGTHTQRPASGTSDLISKGMSFFGDLAKSLSTPESRQRLVDDLVKEDPATGKASISIPVADKKTVSNFLNLAASFLSALGK